MKTVGWESPAPPRLQEFRQILREAQHHYREFPDSQMETRIWLELDGRVGGRRMTPPFEMAPADALTWPVVDLSAKHPKGRGWLGVTIDEAFTRALRLRCDFFLQRAERYLEQEAS